MSYSLRQNLANPANYTAGRAAKVNKIIIHHAATTDFDGIARTFQNPSRKASAHYGVGRNNNVDKYVDEGNTAWHCGNWNGNATSVGIENVNSSGAPNWSIDPATFNTLVELVRDIAKRHGLLPLKVGSNLFGHSDFSATACPGVLKGRLQELADKVNGGTSGGSKGGGSTSHKKSNDQVANEVLQGKWGNNPERTNRLNAAGYNAAAIQAIVNQKIGGNTPQPAQPQSISVGNTVQFKSPVDYNGTRLGVSGNYTVMEVRGDRAVVGRNGVVTAAVRVSNLRRV